MIVADSFLEWICIFVSGSKLIKKTRNSRIWHPSELLQISSCATWFSIW
uniref:Uncharacterized protein n=1 Tax=Cucumis melo TaxID=3656 RepID=A0A9I9D6L5_CUCME